LNPVVPDVFSPRGMYAPTITAFEKDEDVSLAGTRAFVRFLLAQGVDGLVPLGPKLYLSWMSTKPLISVFRGFFESGKYLSGEPQRLLTGVA
jgi:hypothetical protein